MMILFKSTVLKLILCSGIILFTQSDTHTEQQYYLNKQTDSEYKLNNEQSPTCETEYDEEEELQEINENKLWLLNGYSLVY